MLHSSPLRSVWFNPAQTVAYIAHENPSYGLFALPIITGFAVWPTVALFSSDSDKIESGLIMSSILAFGPVIELLQVFIGAYLIRLTGFWMGGKAGIASIQAAIVWGNVPIAVITIVGAALLVFSSTYEELAEAPLTWNHSLAVAALAWTLFATQLVIVCWSFVIFLRGLAKVQGYSLPRAMLNAALAWLLPAIVIVILAIVFGYGDSLPWLFFAGFDDLVMSSGP